MFINEYFAQLQHILSASAFIASVETVEDARTPYEGFFKARIVFFDNSILSFREYLTTSVAPPKKYSYAFHYFKDKQLIFRYDNTPHFPSLKTFPHHKHLANGNVVESIAPSLSDVLKEIETHIVI
ncbi:MAG: hypothetical protein KGZ58_06935 [Ignavibacteriales bacterium]|nr:hypothetical protein [Ignavibacteriales bacterium]